MSQVTVLDGRLTQMSDEGDIVRVRVTDKRRQIVDCLLHTASPALSQLNLRKRYVVKFEEIPESEGGETP